MANALIRIDGVSKRFGEVSAVDDVSLEIGEGEFFALLGPSGCGKTTLLRMLAGLELPSGGRIAIDGADMAGVPPNRRPVNMVFQSYAVFPHMTVHANVGYGLRMDGVGRAERDARVAEALRLVKLEEFAGRKPDQLSGGQRQRVALARALVKRPRVLLLDEPLSALDAKLREAMRFELARIQARVGVTFVMVTHDQDEAMALATRCALMHGGRLQQVDVPAALYERPANRFVAGFIGDINLFEATAAGLKTVDCAALGGRIAVAAYPGAAGTALSLGLRPEKIAMEPGAAGVPARTGRVVRSAYLGSETVYEVALAGGCAVKVRRGNARAAADGAPAVGDAVTLSWTPDALMVLGE